VVDPRRACGRDLAAALAHSGEEAVLAARACEGLATVIVGETRQAAVDLAATLADTLVVDGVLQTAPGRASLSLLALDAESRWGRGAVPPRGDLRAPVHALLAACDLPVVVADPLAADSSAGEDTVAIESHGALSPAGAWLTFEDLSKLRVGLFLALARPDRVVRFLARRGVVPSHIHALPDHTPPNAHLAITLARARARTRAENTAPHGIDLWLATPKCALLLEAAGVPHAVLSHTLALSPRVRDALRAVP
jgi:tetraacyldisaccharide-1-P 4'-kinase